MEAAGDDVDDNEADTQTHTNTLTQRRRTTFAAMQLMQIYWKMLGNIFAFFSAAFSFVPITFFSSFFFFLHFIRTYLASFAVHLQFYCVLQAKGQWESGEREGKKEEKKYSSMEIIEMSMDGGG